MSIVIQALLFSLVPFAFSLLMDYCFGKPASKQYDSKAIFWWYPFILAKRALQKVGKYKEVITPYAVNIRSKNPAVSFISKGACRAEVFNMGKEYFTREQGWGMCPVCTNVRVSIFYSIFIILLFGFSWYMLFLVPVFSNLFMLLYQKL